MPNPNVTAFSTKNRDCSRESEHDNFRYAASQPTGGNRKSVSFNRAVKAYKVIHINDYTEEEIAATWYSASETEAVKMNIAATLTLMNEKGNSIDSDEYCSRGLEHLTNEGTENRRRRRDISMRGVFDEQELQYEDNEFDDELIADMYSHHTRFSRSFALVLGQGDEQAAKEIYKDYNWLTDSSMRCQLSPPAKLTIPILNAAVLAAGNFNKRLKQYTSRAA